MTKTNILKLVREFDSVRAEVSTLEKKKKDLQDQIRDFMGDDEDAEVVGYGMITYRYDAEKEVTVLDEEKLKEKYPKAYKECCKTKTVGGARRLIVTPQEAE